MHPDKFMGKAARSAAPVLLDGERSERLEQLGQVIAGKRKEAVDARKESGIEAVWLACEEAYLGMDDANRHEFNEARWSKPTSINGPVTQSHGARDDTRSTAFVRLTSRYVDGASSKLGEIILPIDDKAFKLDATPDPDLVKQSKDLTPIIDAAGQPVPKPPEDPTADAATMMPGQTPAAGGPMTVGDQAKQLIAQAADCAQKAETRLYDWMVEAKYPAEARKVINDAARIGVGVLKGPVPDFKESRAITKAESGIALQIVRKVVPGIKWADPWNFFPADGCGENVHDGDGLFERDFLSEKRLKALKKDSDYIGSQIDKVIEEGPGKVYEDGTNPNDNNKKKRGRYEIWYYYGTLKREDFEAASANGAKDIPVDKEDVHAIVSMVNDTVIRAVLNPSDAGSFPFRVVTWSRRAGHWAGVGVGEQLAMPQRAVNAATRALFNNAGWSAGVQIVIDQLGIVPADGNWKITPNKIWYKTAESTSAKVQDAFNVIEVPSVQAQLSAIIEYAMKLAEESTGIPLVTQGRDGPTTPQTFGQAELQDANSHTWLRSIGYRYDDMVTEPLVQDLYEWLLLDENVPDEEKGDFNINANGSAAMVERAIQEQFYVSLIAAAANPATRLAPAKITAEIVKSKRIDPRKVQYSDEEWAKISQQPPPKAPQVQVAEINASATLHKQDMADKAALEQVQAEAAHEQQLLQSGGTTPHMATATARIEAERIRATSQENIEASRAASEQAYASTEAQIARDNAAARHQEIMDKRELAILTLMINKGISTDEIKAALAKTSIVEQTKRQLAQVDVALSQSEGHADRTHDLVKHVATIQNDSAMHQAELEAAAQTPPEPK